MNGNGKNSVSSGDAISLCNSSRGVESCVTECCRGGGRVWKTGESSPKSKLQEMLDHLVAKSLDFFHS